VWGVGVRVVAPRTTGPRFPYASPPPKKIRIADKRHKRSAPIDRHPRASQIAHTAPCAGLAPLSIGGARFAYHNRLPLSGGVVACRMPAKHPDLAVVDLASIASAPPANLGEAGIRFWEGITAEYDISDAGGRALLEQAAFAYNRAERLRIEIERDGEILHGRNGAREHPGMRGELAARALVCRTLQKLGINLEPVRLSSGRPSGPGWRGRDD
jgi:hypothetical protein